MIRYNFPYRGPYEYEKFILNILQFHNTVFFLQDELSHENIEGFNKMGKLINDAEKNIKESQKTLNKSYEIYLTTKL